MDARGFLGEEGDDDHHPLLLCARACVARSSALARPPRSSAP